MRTVDHNGHPDRHMSAQKQLSDVSQGDYAMLSQSSQDQTQAMEEGTPPEKGLSTGACPNPALSPEYNGPSQRVC